MSLLSWNYRGLGNHWTIQALKRAIKIEEPDLVFLMETKLLEDAMKGKKYEVGFTQGLIVPSEGRSGGLALLWKPKTCVKIRGYSKWFIDAEIMSNSDQGGWRFTGFYGQPDTCKREETW